MIQELTSPEPEAVNEPSNRLRWLELSLVLFVAFGGSIAVSLFAVFTRANLYGRSTAGGIGFAGVILELSGLAVFFYVLFRQGRSLRDLGVSFKWTDIPVSIGLAVLGLILLSLSWQVIALSSLVITGKVVDPTQRNVEFVTQGFSIFVLLLILLNPFFEEMIVRAFLMTDVKSLTGSTVIAIVSSVVIQSTYHLYQGVVPAVMYSSVFLVFSVYYALTRRALPVILAHFYFDFYAIVYYALR